MSIQASGTNYMSNAYILGWMETKTEGIYGNMRDAMDTANTRGDAEAALNAIKAKLGEVKTHNATPAEVQDLMNKAIEDFKDVPEVAKALSDYVADLNGQQAHVTGEVASLHGQINRLQATIPNLDARARGAALQQLNGLNDRLKDATLKIDDAKADQWVKDIGSVVDGLGKQDQLGMVNIQEFNAQLNQAKQTASALMDAADKAANAIISHIA